MTCANPEAFSECSAEFGLIYGHDIICPIAVLLYIKYHYATAVCTQVYFSLLYIVIQSFSTCTHFPSNAWLQTCYLCLAKRALVGGTTSQRSGFYCSRSHFQSPMLTMISTCIWWLFVNTHSISMKLEH